MKTFRDIAIAIIIAVSAIFLLRMLGEGLAWTRQNNIERRAECIKQTKNPMYCWEAF